jgi:hypothetical protein
MTTRYPTTLANGVTGQVRITPTNGTHVHVMSDQPVTVGSTAYNVSVHLNLVDGVWTVGNQWISRAAAKDWRKAPAPTHAARILDAVILATRETMTAGPLWVAERDSLVQEQRHTQHRLRAAEQELSEAQAAHDVITARLERHNSTATTARPTGA